MRGLISCMLATIVLACSGPGSKTPTPQASDAGMKAAAPEAHLISTLPTDVRNPPPFHLESKHAKLREHPEWAACHAAFQPSQEPAKALAALGGGCSAVTKMHALGAPMTGSQNAISSQPVTYAFRAQAKHCYRVYGAAGSGVKSLVAVLSDESGAAVAEYHTDDVSPFIAPDEAICFADDTDLKIAVSVGVGDGTYALQLWSE